MESKLPWNGQISLNLDLPSQREFNLHLRIPSWSEATSLKINGEAIHLTDPSTTNSNQTASGYIQTAPGYDPFLSRYLTLKRTWHSGDHIELEFDMSIQI
jgi:DUF1680 family protein